MSNSDTRTITRADGESRADQHVLRHCLYLVLDAERPLAPPARWNLDDVDRVTIGRANGVADADRGRRDGAALSLGLPDREMSGEHARMTRTASGWTIEDRGSKNGTLVNGARIDRTTLVDGDLLELGHTFLLYHVASMPRVPDVATEADLGQPIPGLTTLVPSFGQQLDAVRRIAASRAPILITGESGTGKELAARAVHDASGRDGRFIAVNCGALPRELIESELFGHKKGAFSGAVDRVGHVRSADRGTLFLDEIGDLPLAVQAAFLRVLQEREVVPLGSSVPVPVDIKLVAATNRDLAGMVEQEQFRGDLYARLAGFSVALPPLRDRRADIGLIVSSLLRRLAGERADTLRLSFEAARALLTHDWPHNVRELENCLSAALALGDDPLLRLEHLAGPVAGAVRDPGARRAGDSRRERLIQTLRRAGGNVSEAARELNTTRAQIHRWAKRYDIDIDAYRD